MEVSDSSSVQSITSKSEKEEGQEEETDTFSPLFSCDLLCDLLLSGEVGCVPLLLDDNTRSEVLRCLLDVDVLLTGETLDGQSLCAGATC